MLGVASLQLKYAPKHVPYFFSGDQIERMFQFLGLQLPLGYYKNLARSPQFASIPALPQSHYSQGEVDPDERSGVAFGPGSLSRHCQPVLPTENPKEIQAP